MLPQLERRDAARDDDAPAEAAVASSAGPDTRSAAADVLIDEDAFAQLAGMRAAGHDDFAARILALYEENAPLALAQIEQAAAAGDRDGCGRAAHSLKSMSLNIGAARVARSALAIETLARENAELPGGATVAALRRGFADTVKEIRDRMAGGSARTSAVAAAPADGDVAIARALENALERDEFTLVYQPIVDRTGTRTLGVEALLRWRRDTGEQIPPNIFIPVAERTGLIHDLGNWVMRRACADAGAWDGIDVSINVSPVQLLRYDFVARAVCSIAESGLDAARVVLEITESTLLSAETPVHTLMSHLNAAGFRFALDDFGTGYASLTSLRHYPFDRIKIDRSFVGSLHTTADATIVHAVIAIAKSLGLKVVAEGVEQVEQQRFLTSAGVNFMQGYLFGRPMSKDDITARLSRERQPRVAQS
jgi:EAL domain-containing protein (putative c-di-GMP-specific phosphodiesterase class I)